MNWDDPPSWEMILEVAKRLLEVCSPRSLFAIKIVMRITFEKQENGPQA